MGSIALSAKCNNVTPGNTGRLFEYMVYRIGQGQVLAYCLRRWGEPFDVMFNLRVLLVECNRMKCTVNSSTGVLS